MKILILVHNLTGGGAERVAASWANGLSEIGNEMSVISDFSIPVSYSLNEDIKRVSLPAKSKNIIIRKLIDPIRTFLFYRKSIKKYRPDVIISVLHINPILLKSALLGLKNRPLSILTDHNAYERPASAPMSFKQIFRKFYLNRLYDFITVLTHRDEEILTKKGFSKIRVLHNPLFLNPIKDIYNKKNIILAVGRIDAWHVKGFDLLIQAWNQLASSYPNWKLRIVGQGSKKNISFLQGLVKHKESVEFVEYTQNIASEYQKAAIFVLSSRYEGWGLVLVEAMSQACACIACDYKGRQGEIISNYKNGLLIKPEKIEELKNAIELLLTNSDLRLRFQNQAPKSVMQFSERKIANDWMKLLSEDLQLIDNGHR